jgi:hypothetical protein
MNYLKGSGTETDPYLINDFNAWKIVASRADTDNFNGKYLKLTNNIDVYGNVKLGRNDNPFNGVFDGNNYKINVNYNHVEGVANQGTFGTIGSNAVIKNVTITGNVVTLNPNSACIGGLVGVNKGGTIINCHNEANVTASGYNVGGLVGIMDGGSITSSTNKGTISSSSSKIGNFQRGIGGIVGTLTNVAKSTITVCQNSGVITAAATQLGGIVGFATGSSTVAHQIVNCVNNGEVTSTKEINSTSNEGVAGIVGMACWYVQITKCTNNETITALNASQVAGIVGKSADSIVIDNCTNNGDIYGYNQVGGIAGRHVGNAVIRNCTNTGDIYGVEGVTYGQIAGHNGATIETNNNENGSSQKYNK